MYMVSQIRPFLRVLERVDPEGVTSNLQVKEIFLRLKERVSELTVYDGIELSKYNCFFWNSLTEECKKLFGEIFRSITTPFFIPILRRQPPHQFPPELVNELFRYLDHDSLFAWLEVCPEFSKYIDHDQLRVKRFLYSMKVFRKNEEESFWKELSDLQTDDLRNRIRTIYRFFPIWRLLDLWEKVGKEIPERLVEAFANYFPEGQETLLFSRDFGSDLFFRIINQRLDQESTFLANTECLIFGLPGSVNIDLLPKLLHRCRGLKTCIFEDDWFLQNSIILNQLPHLRTLSVFIPVSQTLERIFFSLVGETPLPQIERLTVFGGGYKKKCGEIQNKLVDRGKDKIMSLNPSCRKSKGELSCLAKPLEKLPSLQMLDIYGITEISSDEIYTLGAHKALRAITFHTPFSYEGDHKQVEFLLHSKWEVEMKSLQQGLERLKKEKNFAINYIDGIGQKKSL